MKIIPCNELNREAWDLLITNSKQGNFYALSWYLDIVSPGWFALVEGLHKEYQIGIPLPVVKKWGIKILKQPLFCQQLGIYSTNPLTKTRADEIIKIIKTKYNYILKYSFNSQNFTELHEAALTENSNIVLSLDRSYELIRANYKRDRRYRVSQTGKSEIQMGEDRNIEELVRMFRENGEKKIYGGVSDSAYDLLRRIYREADARGMATLIYAKIPTGNIIAGALFIRFRNRITYLFNAAYSEFVKLNGRTLILDSVIRQFENESLTLDFESPGIKNIDNFYRSFGSYKEVYLSISQNRLPWPIKKIQAIRRKLL